jgi:hypothetical protein
MSCAMHRHSVAPFAAAFIFIATLWTDRSGAAELQRVRVAQDGRSFQLDPSGKAFIVWGVNYDHDRKLRLLEEYWNDQWPTVEQDFNEIIDLGANVVRIHLQFRNFMDAPDRPNAQALAQLRRLVALAERSGLYLDVTGLACYRKRDVPRWYDALSESQRWDAQARFWEAVAGACAASPAVFCYDLMNEPVAVGGDERRDDWLDAPFAGMTFTQAINLEGNGRRRSDVALAWLRKMTAAVRKHDRRTLITVGLLDWSLDRPGERQTGFVPALVAGHVDFIAVHIYPSAGKIREDLETLRGFNVGKPVVVEETFPLRCSVAENAEFIEKAAPFASGWISFYWGKRIEEYDTPEKNDGRTQAWLNYFRSRGRRSE